MPSVYLANVIGTGLQRDNIRPSVPAGTPYSVLMIDPVKAKCMIVSTINTLTGTGIVLVVTGTTWQTLRSESGTTSPPNGKRNTINSWCSTNGYQPITAGMTWTQAIEHIARQVNPAADLSRTSVR